MTQNPTTTPTRTSSTAPTRLPQDEKILKLLLATSGVLAVLHLLLGIFGDCQQALHYVLALIHAGLGLTLYSRLGAKPPDDTDPGTPPHGGGG